MAADVAEVVQYNEDSASPLTVSKPASFASGEILVAVIGQHGGVVGDLTTPSGWTQQGSVSTGTGSTDCQGKVFSHVFSGGDPSTWDFPYFSGSDVTLQLFRITGADTTPTIVVTSTAIASIAGSNDSPTVTPSGADDLLICNLLVTAQANALVETDPSGMTDRGQTQVAGNFMAEAGASQQLVSGSATGVRTWTSVTPTGDAGGTFSIAVKSAAAGGETPDSAGPRLKLVTRFPFPRSPLFFPFRVPQPSDAPDDTAIPVPVLAVGSTPRPGYVALISRSLADPAVAVADTPPQSLVYVPPARVRVVPEPLVTQTAAVADSLPRSFVVTPGSPPRLSPEPVVTQTAATAAAPVDDTPPRPYVVIPASVRTTPPAPSISRMVTDTPIAAIDTPPVSFVETGPTPRPGVVSITSRSTADPTPTDTPPASFIVVPTTTRRFGAVIVNQPRVEEGWPRPALLVTPPAVRRPGTALLARSLTLVVTETLPVAFVFARPTIRRPVPSVVRRIGVDTNEIEPIGNDGVITTATTGRAYITSSGLSSTTTTQSPAATTASGLVIRTTTPGG